MIQPLSFKGLLLLIVVLTVVSDIAVSAENVIYGNAGSKLLSKSFGEYNQPWAMTFLPGGDLLITEKPGHLLLFRVADGARVPVKGLPSVAYAGQGGLGDVVLHPQFSENNWVYLSYAEQDLSGKRGAVVVRATLNLGEDPTLEHLEPIWRQTPKVTGAGHYSHRLAFGPDGHLYITSGDRQTMDPAQRWDQDLGKVIRLKDDGSVPEDNPFQDNGERAKIFWSLGHRNLLGLAFDQQGQLWAHEMGPRHGDELNLIVAGDNYGWPIVSWGNHYSGLPIPDHDKRPEFKAPQLYWVPTVAPSGLVIYSGSMFPQWQGNAFLGGLRSRALVRVEMAGEAVKEVERFDMKARIREVEQGPDGALWVLEDGNRGRLLKLTPLQKLIR